LYEFTVSDNGKKSSAKKTRKIYKDTSELRYGKIMIFCDADPDGSHIKGLLMNMLNTLWPELSEVKDFITCLPTPVVKVSKGKQVIPFYSLTDFEKWKENTNTKGWSHKYYKGLGTSTAQEGKEYFRSYDKELIKYNPKDDKCIAALKMAFEGGKDRANERKEWLGHYDFNNIIEPKQKEVSYEEFINKELIHFSNYDCVRSIPSVCDGFKPVQRKIMFSSFKRNLKSDVKVAQFSGYVSEHSAYHHGEMSLQGAIIKMAQNFVGSNNINLLFPSGQMGTRIVGGDDHASPRYIFTRLEEITASIFNKLDEPLYEYLDDDGQKIEPQWYLPLIPMILVNGTKGIGTGFSTDVPCYNPLDLVKNIRRLLEEEEIEEMRPWYRGFDGEIRQIEDQKFECRGKYEIVNDTTFKITELPVGTWTQKYEETLDSLVIDSSIKDAKKKKMQCITDFDKGNGCTDTKVEFIIKMPKVRLTAYKKDKDKLEKDFKLVTTINTTNMHLYNEKLQLRKYNNVEDILKEFYELRLDYYLKRKVYWLIKIKKELDIMAAKIRFIQFVRDQKIDIRKPEEDIIEILEENNFPKFSNKESSLMKEEDEINEDELNYDYLLRMQIRTLTQKVMEKMMKEHEMRMAEYKELEKKSNKDLWKEDLDTFEKVYQKFMKEWTQLQMEESGTTKKKIIKKKVIKNV
jgi:DNA topoisomerase-2